MSEQTMRADDAVYGSLASCYITIDGRRWNFMNIIDFESKYEINVSDVKILGRTSMGHKPAGAKGTWSGTAHYNQSIMRTIALKYKRTGFMSPFEIQVTNEDPSSAVGRQVITHMGCLSDTFTLAKFAAGEDLLEEDISGTFDDWDMPEKFKELAGM